MHLLSLVSKVAFVPLYRKVSLLPIAIVVFFMKLNIMCMLHILLKNKFYDIYL